MTADFPDAGTQKLEAAVAGMAVTASPCSNCGATGGGEYCPACGQETREPPAISEFFHGSLTHFLSLESKVASTLLRLVTAPGMLTVDYLEGRRARYVRPLRLYLWISVLTVAVIELFDLQLGLRVSERYGIFLLESVTPVAGDAGVHGLRPMQFVLDTFDSAGLRHFRSLSAEERAAFIDTQRKGNLQYFMLFLVPVFAVIVQLCFADRRRPYGAHLVFCLHAQSFLLLMLLAEAALPGLLAAAVSAWIVAYYYLSLRRVYAGSIGDVLARGTAALLLLLAGFLAMAVLLVLVILQA